MNKILNGSSIERRSNSHPYEIGAMRAWEFVFYLGPVLAIE